MNPWFTAAPWILLGVILLVALALDIRTIRQERKATPTPTNVTDLHEYRRRKAMANHPAGKGLGT